MVLLFEEEAASHFAYFSAFPSFCTFIVEHHPYPKEVYVCFLSRARVCTGVAEDERAAIDRFQLT